MAAKALVQEELLPELRSFQGRLSESPTVLKLFFERWKAATNLMDKVYYYAIHSRSVNLLDPAAASRASEARALMATFSAQASFYREELTSHDPQRLQSWMDEEANQLQFLRPLALQLQQSDPSSSLSTHHARTPLPRAKMLPVYNALLSEIPFSPATDALHAAVPLSQSNLASCLSDPDASLRRTAWQSQADGLLRFQHTLASVYSAHIGQELFRTETIGAASTFSAALADRKIPEPLFHSFIASFRRCAPIFHRYFRVLCRFHGVEKMHYADLLAPLSQDPFPISYPRGVQLICDALIHHFGPDYVEKLRRGCLEDRWVDRAMNRGKQSGSFSFSAEGMLPFAFLSFSDDFRSVSNLAHELGHSMHHVLTRESQHRLYHEAGNGVLGEVPSHVHQALLRSHILGDNQRDDDARLQLEAIVDAMRLYFNYFFLIPILCEFEMQAHARAQAAQSVSAQSLSGILLQLFRAGLGPSVDIDEDRMGVQWARYNALFYSFSSLAYPIGIAVADTLVPMLQSGAPHTERYLALLRSGCTKPPIEALYECGVDLHSPDLFQASYLQIESLIEKLENLLRR